MNSAAPKWLTTIILILALIAYTLTAFSYMYENFVSKDTFQIIYDDIKHIRTRVDLL